MLLTGINIQARHLGGPLPLPIYGLKCSVYAFEGLDSCRLNRDLDKKCEIVKNGIAGNCTPLISLS